MKPWSLSSTPRIYSTVMFLALLFVTGGHKFTAQGATGVTWEEQAERLQAVNASFLDAFPMGEPLAEKRSVELRAIVSVLPVASPRVGGKLEKAPAAPFHTIPTVQVNGEVYRDGPLDIGAQGWGGYLFAGSEKLVGLKVSLSQWLLGGAVNLRWTQNDFEFFSPLGVQYASARAKGAITEPSANDSFTSSTALFYAAPGVRYVPYSVWANVLLAKREAKSQFKIPSDSTQINITDSQGDSAVPISTQVAAGWYHSSGVQLGLGQLFVPKRVAMPRLLFSYQYAIR